MAENSPIEWTDSTFNPWIGCTKVSPGCDNCYAAAQDKFRGWTPEGWGGPRKRTSLANWHRPVLWNAQQFVQCPACGWRGEWREADERQGACPSCARIPPRYLDARRRVFCASLADVFDNQVPREWRADLFALIRSTPNLDWLLLTKRVGNAGSMIAEAMRDQGDEGDEHAGWPWPNVWIGATVVNQEEAERDIPKLLATPARVRFLSMEPLLGPVLLRCCWLDGTMCCLDCGLAAGTRRVPCTCPPAGTRLHWVIVGGESGPGARPAQLQWIRSIVRQGQAANVPVLVKQLGREVLDDGMSSPGEHWPAGMVRRPIPRREESDPGFAMRLKHAKGGDWSEWPEDLRVRQFPEVR